MISSKNSETVQHRRRNDRMLHVASKEKTRCRSLPRISDKKFLKEELNPCADTKVSQTLSHQMPIFSTLGMSQSTKEETVEVPVIIDEATKWISGVTEHTTCQDIIKVVLVKETNTLQVINNQDKITDYMSFI